MPVGSLTDLQRAARFLYLQKQAFGGKVSGRSFGTTLSHGSRFNMNKIGPILEDVHERLAGVVIENLDFGAFIEKYDNPFTLFYLDPPYYGVEGYYDAALFKRDDFERLAAVLRGVKGRFIMSINDTPQIRKIFGGFEIEEISTRYSLAGADKTKIAVELLVTGGIGLSPDHNVRKDYLARKGRVIDLTQS